MNYEIGARVLDYEILAVLGAGGMGKVYKVRNVISNRIEAMKVLLANLQEHPELADRFVREIQLQATLSHPNIASLHTALYFENQLLMLMEFVDGMTLDALIKSGPLRLDEACDYMAQVLDALSYAHDKGIIHRDLKPANMMLTHEGRIKLLDFGIAKLAADRSLTRTGFLIGSLPYMSPEQVQGAAEIDARADIYSLGISLYEAVTGRQPFQADSEYSLMRAHLQEAPVPPVQLVPGLPQGLNDIILTAVAKDPAQRFQTAAAMGAALRSISPSAAPAPTLTAQRNPPPPPPIPQPKQFSSRGLYIALGSLVTIAVLIAAALQAPRWFSTRAGEPAAVPAAVTTKPAEPAPEPAPAEPAAESAAPAPAPPTSRAASGSERVQSAPATSRAASGSERVQPAPPTSRAASGSERAQPAPSDPVQQPPQQAAQPPAPQQPSSSAAELRALREQLMLLGTRATAVKSSLDRLRQEQARQGLGLRGDITSSSQRMEFYLDEAEAAIKSGDAPDAKKSLESAEREVTKLERFLGR